MNVNYAMMIVGAIGYVLSFIMWGRAANKGGFGQGRRLNSFIWYVVNGICAIIAGLGFDFETGLIVAFFERFL